MTAFRTKTISVACALALAAGCVLPAQALAAPQSSQTPATESSAGTADTRIPIDRASGFAPDESVSLLSADLDASVAPHAAFSDEFLYFTEFESGKNYDMVLSYGDGYHAMGCYQFDNRYGLQDFLIACYNYNPERYSMLSWLKDDTLDISNEKLYDWDAEQLTELGQRLNASWSAAYNANPAEFSRLQDGWFYQDYVKFALALCDNQSHAFNMSGRADCVKGLVSGICNLFGSGGMQFFVGGTLYGEHYDGAPLTGDMTDREFVTTLCDYIVEHVEELPYINKQYVSSYKARYEKEKRICLSYLPEDDPAPTPDPTPDPDPAPDPTPDPDPDLAQTKFADVGADAWYANVVSYVSERNIMNGYESEGSWYFSPDAGMERGMVVTVLWRLQGEPQADVNEEVFDDVDYNAYYGVAVRWAKATGIINGYTNNEGREVFEPNRAVTREELAVIFANFAQKMDGKRPTSDGANLAKYPDAAEVDSWAKNATAWAIDSGLISGVDESGSKYIRPTKRATRAEAAAILMRYLQKR